MRLSGVLENAKTARTSSAMVRYEPDYARLLTGLPFDIAGGEGC